MQIATQPSTLDGTIPSPQYIPLAQEPRATLNTREAAFHLNRHPQTLRTWASLESGPLRPMRVSGRLAWNVSEIKKILKVA